MKTRLKIGGGIIVFAVFLLLGGYRYMELSVILPWSIAVVSHELGHLISAKLCGAEVESFTLDVAGAKMSLSGKLISYGDELFIAASGPIVNLAMAAFAFNAFPRYSAFSLALGLLNLFPVSGFDGCRILQSSLSLIFGADFSAKASDIISFATVVVLWIFAVYVLVKYKTGFSLFALTFLILGKKAKKRG